MSLIGLNTVMQEDKLVVRTIIIISLNRVKDQNSKAIRNLVVDELDHHSNFSNGSLPFVPSLFHIITS